MSVRVFLRLDVSIILQVPILSQLLCDHTFRDALTYTVDLAGHSHEERREPQPKAQGRLVPHPLSPQTVASFHRKYVLKGPHGLMFFDIYRLFFRIHCNCIVDATFWFLPSSALCFARFVCVDSRCKITLV